jgi:hypothetical protein
MLMAMRLHTIVAGGSPTMATTALHFPHAAADEQIRIATVTALPATGASDRLLHVLFRATVLVLAVAFGGAGLLVLSSPLAVPFTVWMWICAAVTIALDIRADLGAERPPAVRSDR